MLPNNTTKAMLIGEHNRFYIFRNSHGYYLTCEELFENNAFKDATQALLAPVSILIKASRLQNIKYWNRPH